MSGYAKFMKDLVTKKRSMVFETIKVSHSCISIMTNNVVVKKDYPREFTITCNIGMFQFDKALCDLGDSINLVLYAIFKKLWIGVPTPTTMHLLMADHSIKRLVGILYDVLVKVDKFIFLADFVILDCEIEAEVHIILGRPFLATGKALVDVENSELMFHVNEAVASVSEVSCVGESLAAILLNFDGKEIQDYDVVVAALSGLDSYSKSPLKLDINLKNRESPLAKRSIEEPPKLELKKCHFMVKDGIVLGQKILGEGIKVDQVKVEVIVKLPPPISRKGFRSFLGHVCFYRRFIKDFSKVALPLSKLLEKQRIFEFDEACVKACLCLNEKLISAPIIVALDWSISFELMCDASSVGSEVVLYQCKRKKIHPV
ncbi:uncharacterized protein [Solanum tuberosum]|uniref:uncharacterized protein n=1 Tax=Solanum tuberosum TaxID=4113 RepID=UPI00073A4A18|nr:PREDICTED: uncharacterized protein LOC107062673 [Solanum tuberosum]